MYQGKILLLVWQHKFKFTAAVLSVTSVDLPSHIRVIRGQDQAQYK